MSQHNRTMAKEHYHDRYKDKDNQYYYNELILENPIEITKTRILL